MTAILIKKVMRKEQTKRDYSVPSCMIIQMNETTNLMETSFPSQHNKAEHKTGPTAAGGAKASPVWQEEEEDGDTQNASFWKD